MAKGKILKWVGLDAELRALSFDDLVTHLIKDAMYDFFVCKKPIRDIARDSARTVCGWQIALDMKDIGQDYDA